MAALRGTYLSILVDGDEYNTQVKAWNISSADADDDDVTFAEAAEGGGKVWTLGLTLTQDMAASSLWRLMWDNPGAQYPVILKPGTGVVSADNPAFTATATVSLPDGVAVGGAASRDRTRFSVEVEWALDAKPVMDTTP